LRDFLGDVKGEIEEMEEVKLQMEDIVVGIKAQSLGFC
jgi:hypothetical protein